MSVVTRLMGRRPRRAALRWETLHAARTSERPEGMADLIARRTDGFTVTGVFTEAECQAAIAEMRRHEHLPAPFGSLLGMPLGRIGPDESRRAYLDDADRCRTIYERAFGVDPHTRVADALGPMATVPLVAPSEDGRRYSAGHVRFWEPGQGGLPAHAGNEFRDQLKDGAMRHLLTTTQVTDHMSYFVVLQRAARGGTLSVYDLVWDDVQETDQPWEDGTRDDSWFAEVPRLRLDPGPGDLIVFGGGWRWHRVDPLAGRRQRVSYGGFCGPSQDGSELHFWA
ncbi:hypothetical protein PO878_15390 [Iamia majanohamensis]|uniref:Uncharacterized protein n=1 Tax=Iamia majanohamensis TaxID=467976 RepID=A0AAF0BR29_9ACTN|nr:hypothetical protein [Iamia majanohamensis]WCO65886.1 hypothetical protein PO878_15390 [Iamia majanohamensis]